MTQMPDSRVALLILQDLGVSLDDLVAITGEDGDRIANWLLGVDPSPFWLRLLAILWSENPDLLERSREIASLLHKEKFQRRPYNN